MMRPNTYSKALEHPQLAEELLITCYRRIYNVKAQHQQIIMHIYQGRADKGPIMTLTVAIAPPPPPGNPSQPIQAC